MGQTSKHCVLRWHFRIIAAIVTETQTQSRGSLKDVRQYKSAHEKKEAVEIRRNGRQKYQWVSAIPWDEHKHCPYTVWKSMEFDLGKIQCFQPTVTNGPTSCSKKLKKKKERITFLMKSPMWAGCQGQNVQTAHWRVTSQGAPVCLSSAYLISLWCGPPYKKEWSQWGGNASFHLLAVL